MDLWDLKARNFKILELSGAASELQHIFDPAEKLAQARKSALEHWKVIYMISELNKKAGVLYMKLQDAMANYKQVRTIKQIHNINFTPGNWIQTLS